MMMPENGHRAHGFSSAFFLDDNEILDELNLNGSELIMDAGCGDGHISIKLLNEYITSGVVYAVDIYDASIEDMEKFKSDINIQNLINIQADITQKIIEIDDETLDIILMVNVFHGFKASRKIDEAVNELSRLIKKDGKIAIMDYKKWDVPKGPPTQFRSSPEELEKIFNKHNLDMIYLNEDIGEDIPEGKSHFLIIFKKRHK